MLDFAANLATAGPLWTHPRQTTAPFFFWAQEATERLRESVEGFFFQRLKGEDGLGMPADDIEVREPPPPLAAP